MVFELWCFFDISGISSEISQKTLFLRIFKYFENLLTFQADLLAVDKKFAVNNSLNKFIFHLSLL